MGTRRFTDVVTYVAKNVNHQFIFKFTIKSINKHILIEPDAYPLELINYILDGLPDVTLQSTRHEVILHGLGEVTSERLVISHDPSVTPMVLMA